MSVYPRGVRDLPRAVRDLREYLTARGARAELGRDLGRSPQLVSDWLSGRRRPSLAMAVALEGATHGRVRAADWVRS